MMLHKNGIDLGWSNVQKNGTVTASKVVPDNVVHPSAFSWAKSDTTYKLDKKEVVGETYESAAIAYIYSRVQDANDNGVGLDGNLMQGAIWEEDYCKLGKTYELDTPKPLIDEANNYKDYREAVEKFKRANQGKVVTYKIKEGDNTIATNVSKKTGTLRTCNYRLC